MDYQDINKEELISEINVKQKEYESPLRIVEKGSKAKEKEMLVLEKLINVSEKIIQYHKSTPNYENFLYVKLEIFFAGYKVLNIFDEIGLGFTAVALAGIKENIKKCHSFIGLELHNKHWKHDSVHAEKKKHKTISRFGYLIQI
jgi:hypothetical protein